jgi:class 3 adenylate cyclase
MTLGADLRAEVSKIFRSRWTHRDGEVVPEPSSIGLGNDAVDLDGVVLYADLAESTAMVDSYPAEFAAEVYKAYLHCAAKVIRAEGGEITAYDGDRIMAVYLGNTKNTDAARTALMLNYARIHIVQPAIEAQYPGTQFRLKHVVGVDSSKLLVARTGIRGANDLVWVGRAANHAAKMSSLTPDYPSRISAEVYNRLHKDAKYSKGQDMWESANWTAMNRTIYRSTYWWTIP